MKENSDALASWKWAVGATYFVAAFNAAIGWFANSNGSGRVGDFQFNGGILFAVGLLYLVLAILANNRIVAALWVAVVLFSLDGIAMVIMSAGSGHFSLWGLWFRIALIAAMYRGIPALAVMAKCAGAAAVANAAQPSLTNPAPGPAIKIVHTPVTNPAQTPDVPPLRVPEVPPMSGYDLSRQ